MNLGTYQNDAFLAPNSRIKFLSESDVFWEVSINLHALSSEESASNTIKKVCVVRKDIPAKPWALEQVFEIHLPTYTVATFDLDFSSCRSSGSLFAKVLNVELATKSKDV